MTQEEIKEALIEFIGSKEYMIKREIIQTEYHESIMIKGYSYPANSETTLEIEIDLTPCFNNNEQKEIMGMNEIQHDNITYLITYKKKEGI